MVIKDTEFTKLAHGVKLDAKKRIVLRGVLIEEDVLFNMYTNSKGQILLDPQVTVPASEAWLFKNPGALASVKRGLKDAAAGKVTKLDIDSL